MPTYRNLSTKKGNRLKPGRGGSKKTRRPTKRGGSKKTRRPSKRGGSKKTRRLSKRRGGTVGPLEYDNNFGSAIKTHMPNLKARCNTLEDYTTLRKALKEYGVEKFHQTETVMGGKKLFSGDYLNIKGSPSPEPPNGRLPFTFFTVMKHADEDDQKLIPDELRDKYIILRNLPELGGSPGTKFTDAHLINKNIDDAAMSNNHQFVGVREMDWYKFNALTFGYGPGGVDEALTMLNELEEIANKWAIGRDIPLENLGCYFHIYPFNSVQSLHMHMVDTREKNINDKSWEKNMHKNMPLEVVRSYFENHGRGEKTL